MIEIRIASANEVVALKELTSTLLPADFSGQLNTEQIDSIYEHMYSQEVRQNGESQGQCFLIASLDGVDCGLASYLKQGPDLFLLTKIQVLPEKRLHGVGEALFKEAVKQIKDSHPTPCKIELTVNSHNKNYPFYEKMGMQKIREEFIDLEEFTLTQDVLEIEV
ncbi:MAG: GNAT family N-acetyltransferase [Succinivibrio sp.]|nr:GNAT family N-acetyltransferase [Succinivibrio sp.]